MAKVSELKFELAGQEWKLPINVGVDGIFKCKIPTAVTDKLKLSHELRHSKLEDLNNEFYTAYRRYQKAETTYEFFIAVCYASCGRFADDENGLPNHSHYHKRHLHLDISFGDIDAVGLRYKVVCLEKIDGMEEWYNATQDEVTKEWFKTNNKFYSRDKYKLLDMNETYLETLNNAWVNMKKLSNMLFKFIEQDKEQMQLTLSKGKLLLN